MLFSREDHPNNPPETWVVVKRMPGLWHLCTKDGQTIEYSLKTRKAGEALKVSGHLVRLYEEDRKWYADHPEVR